MTELMKFEEKMKMLGEYIGGYKQQLGIVLPSHLNSERLLRIAYNTVRRTPKLLDCSFDSIVGALLEAAYLGLEPAVGGQCWLIPFAKQAVLVAGYKGLIQLGYRSDQIQAWEATAVFSKDFFEFNDFPTSMEHKRFDPIKDRVLNDDGDCVKIEYKDDPLPGELVGAYSVARMHAGRETWVYMNKFQIEAIKKRSPGAKKEDSPWNSSDVYVEAEMWKKTAIRRHSKILPMSIEYNRLADLDDRADLQLPQNLDDNIKAMEAAVQGEDEPQSEDKKD